MMAQLPYGANITINSITTQSSVGHFYTKSHSDYITSAHYPSTITFNYEEQNCVLDSISTNLTYNWDKENKKITFSNEEIFETTIVPDIVLLCNDVKLPIVIDSRGGWFVNKWRGTIQNEAYNRINFYYDAENYVTGEIYYTVSWNSEEENQPFISMNNGSGYDHSMFINAYYDYIDNDGKIKSDSVQCWWDKGNSWNNGPKFTIPKLNGELSSFTTEAGIIKRRFINRFILTRSISLNQSYTICQSVSNYYLDRGKYEVYSTSTFLPEYLNINERRVIESFFGLPVSYTTENEKWHSGIFYKTFNNDGEEVYISPSTSKINVMSNYTSCVEKDPEEHGFITSSGWNVASYGEVVTGWKEPNKGDGDYYVPAKTKFKDAKPNSEFPSYYKVKSVLGYDCWTNLGIAY